jgi:predicted ATP-binding protein involved in virulence
MAISPKSSLLSETLTLDRLVHFEVEALFGQYSYRIPVNVEKRVTAIIAPNGSGKTICLRLIAALFAKKWSFFSELEFGTAKYVFQSGRQVTIRRDRTVVEAETSSRLGIAITL